MDPRGGSREFWKHRKSKANVNARGNVGEHQFSKKASVGVTKLFSKGSGSGGTFSRTDGVVDKLVAVGRKRFFGDGRGVNGSIPTMGFEEAVNIWFTGDFNIIAGLEDVDSIEFSGNSFVDKRYVILVGLLEQGTNASENLIGEFRSGGSKEEIIDLTEHDNFGTVESALVYICFMGGVLESEIRGEKDPIDMFLPEAAGFWVALECTEQGNDMGAVDWSTFAFAVPIGKLVADADEGGSLGTRGMCICVADVAFVDSIVKVGRESHKKALSGLTDARRVSLGQVTEFGGTTRRAIATSTGAALTGCLDGVIPEGINYDSTIFRSGTRLAMHAKEVEAIELLVFASAPFGPGAEFEELVASELAHKTFFSSGVQCLKGAEELIYFINR
jgi:hypothetical protein